MKTKLLLIIFTASLAASCKKSDKTIDQPDPEFLQLQEVEHSIGTFSFQYNSANQLIKVDQKERNESGLSSYQYTNFIWSNGVIQLAEMYQKSNNIFYKRADLKYQTDGQKRIASIARTWYYPNGILDRKDTVEFTFNADNKLVGMEFGEENYHKFAYDNKGNYMPDNEEELNENEVYGYSYDFRYDNKINPFSQKSLGLYVFSVYFDEPFLINQLLSTNNPVYAKTTISFKVMGEGNQPVYSNENSYTSGFTYTYDTNGGIEKAGLNYIYQRKENGNIVDGYAEDSEWKYTCVKK